MVAQFIVRERVKDSLRGLERLGWFFCVCVCVCVWVFRPVSRGLGSELAVRCVCLVNYTAGQATKAQSSPLPN